MLAALAAIPLSAFSMTLHDAGGNLFVFEFARQSADYCEEKGFSVRAHYDAWLKENEPLQGKSIAAISTESKKNGLSQAEIEKIMSGSDAFIRQKAASLIKEQDVPCDKFQAMIDKFSAYLKK